MVIEISEGQHLPPRTFDRKHVRDHLSHVTRRSRSTSPVTRKILKQVGDGDFERQLPERLELAEREKQNAVELAKANVSHDLQKTTAAKDAEIQDLKSRLEASAVIQKLAVSEALGAVEKERDRLAKALAERERRGLKPQSMQRLCAVLTLIEGLFAMGPSFT
ncbi:hypothetical protein ACVIGB_008682 [Bradyrhizobium sp. USDA 4341]